MKSNIPEKDLIVVNKLLSLFVVEGKRADTVLTDAQKEIFWALVIRRNKRVQILTSTQYGKSLTVALACVVISCIDGEVVAVVAPSDEKAKIIMRYYVEHLADHQLFSSKLEKETKLDRLRMEENKDRIILKNNGGIFTLSANAGNSKKGVESAMGAGARIVITDESSLIPDDIEATIYRMLAGKGPEGFYCKIGNPFYRNHFYRSWNDPTYHKIFIDYKRGLQEGRYTQAFIDEARRKPKFDILYECLFPAPESLDATGHSVLYTEDFLKSRINQDAQIFGRLKIGADVAGEGKNYSVIVLRGKNAQKILYKEHNPDPINFATKIIEYAKIYGLTGPLSRDIFVDMVGIGNGTYWYLKGFKETEMVTGVNAGERAEDNDMFYNKRAEMYWRQKQWLSSGVLVGTQGDWVDMLDIRYKVASDRRVRLKSKDEMLKDGVQSPDVSDASSLTFYTNDIDPQQPYIQHGPLSKYEGTQGSLDVPQIISEADLAKL